MYFSRLPSISSLLPRSSTCSQDCRWLQRQSGFLQRAAGPTICCCDQKGLQTSFPMRIQHGKSDATTQNCSEGMANVSSSPAGNVGAVRSFTRYYQSQRKSHERKTWCDPGAKLNPTSSSSFLLQSFFIFPEAFCWCSLLAIPWLWARQCFILLEPKLRRLKTTDVEKNPTQWRIWPSILKQTILSFELISLPMLCSAQL